MSLGQFRRCALCVAREELPQLWSISDDTQEVLVVFDGAAGSWRELFAVVAKATVCVCALDIKFVDCQL